jgi:NitT/TauT family transport system substrate-binding protein
MHDRRETWGRRAFLGGLTMAGTAGLLGMRPEPVAAEPPPETKRVRLLHRPSLCDAPQFVAEELLQGEGFTDIKYVKLKDFGATEAALTSGDADITMTFGVPMIPRIDAGEPIVFLAGVHVGCVEVFAKERLRTIRELKGKTFAVSALRTGEHFLIGSIAAHVGLQPEKDINWVIHPISEWQGLLANGKIDAFLGFPPLAQETRAKKIGHVILNTLTDRPWSQYFCCMVVGNREFVQRNPVATKRAIRAILKASEICALQPERVARFLVDKGYVERSDYAVQSMKEVVYGKWREYDPNDAVRFYSLRLHEAGMIKSTPQRIIAQGTDWRFFNELKKELKG